MEIEGGLLAVVLGWLRGTHSSIEQYQIGARDELTEVRTFARCGCKADLPTISLVRIIIFSPRVFNPRSLQCRIP